eukprot:3923392-Heterocapsa_arctica.AAC.1
MARRVLLELAGERVELRLRRGRLLGCGVGRGGGHHAELVVVVHLPALRYHERTLTRLAAYAMFSLMMRSRKIGLSQKWSTEQLYRGMSTCW